MKERDAERLRVLEARWKAVHDGLVCIDTDWEYIDNTFVQVGTHASIGHEERYYEDMRDFDMDLDEYILENSNGATT